ncbi:hypothetical protein ACNF42_00325 [Cuniculiplasma sp. SKW3]|uniref:hypothetical protein n=1 Tax=unclassified Cuniculiplasma TaxID=2619706 RepID=UPI003FD684D5
MIYILTSYNLGKAFIFLTIFYMYGYGFLNGINHWDSTYYIAIARYGYLSLQSQAFSPVFPFLIRSVDYVFPRGYDWFVISAILIVNIFGEAFVIYLYRKRGYKISVLVAIFPVFLLFSTIPYSDDISLFFICLFIESTDAAAIGAFSFAMATFLNLAYAIPSLIIKLKRWWLFPLPAIVGVVAVLAFWHYDGSPFIYFTIERKYWGVFFGTPIIQGGSIMSSYLHYGIPSIVYLMRNYIFFAIFLFGSYLLAKSKTRKNIFLSVYTFSIEIPLLFVVGVPEFSIPRLLLPAFPALFPYADYVKTNRFIFFYVIIGILLGVIFTVWQYKSFFS